MNMIMFRGPPHHQPHRLPYQQLTPTSPLDFADKIPFKELQILHGVLGRGSYGTVFRARWRGRDVAVKAFKEKEEINSFLVEVKQLSCVKHPNIVTLYGASSGSDAAYLIMEYAEGGSLSHLLHECKQQHYDLSHACSWAMQTAKGVAYLHGFRPKPIMHRDLKPANLLLFSRGKRLKICDFGTACAVKTQMTNNTGSVSYMAPEVFQSTDYSESADVFSWSIIFWEILARRHPYPQNSQPYHILWGVNVQNLRPAQLESCPEIIWELITKCWVKPPGDRPTMQQVSDQMEFIFSLTDSGRRYSNTSSNQQAATTTTSPNQKVVHIEHQASPDPKSPQMRQFCRLLPAIPPFNTCYTSDITTQTDQQQQQSTNRRMVTSSNMEFSNISSRSSFTRSINRNKHHQHQQTTSSVASSFNQEKLLSQQQQQHHFQHQHQKIHEHQHHHPAHYQNQKQNPNFSSNQQQYQYPAHVASLRSFCGPNGQQIRSGVNENQDDSHQSRLQKILSRPKTRDLYLRRESLRRDAEILEGSEHRQDTARALREFEELKRQTEVRRREIGLKMVNRVETSNTGMTTNSYQTTTTASSHVVFKTPLPKSPQPPPPPATTTCATSPDERRGA